MTRTALSASGRRRLPATTSPRMVESSRPDTRARAETTRDRPRRWLTGESQDVRAVFGRVTGEFRLRQVVEAQEQHRYDRHSRQDPHRARDPRAKRRLTNWAPR